MNSELPAPVDLPVPALPPVAQERRLVAADVTIDEQGAQHTEAVDAFLSDLAAVPPLEQDGAPTARHLAVAHPTDPHTYATYRSELAGVSLLSVPVGEPLDSVLAGAKEELDDRHIRSKDMLTFMRGNTRNLTQPLRDAGTVLQTPDQLPCATPPAGRPAADDPAPYIVQVAIMNPNSNFSVTQVILAGAHHTLADLRDAIYCVTDKNARQCASRTSHGALFYLSDRIYTDTRDASAPDYAAPVHAFLQAQAHAAHASMCASMAARNLPYEALEKPVPRARAMHDAPLGSLTLHVAHSGYLYVHAGACEHMVVVQDVRARHAGDPPLGAAPVTTFLKRPTVRRCCICTTRPACKVAHNDDLAPTTPAFFCDLCFDELHAPVEGAEDDDEDDGDLVVYPYVHE